MINPYKGLSDYCFWSRSMASQHPGQIDPVTKFAEILPSHKVATMGSCFAQHLAKHIISSGLNYYIPELAPSRMSEQIAAHKNYGVFSARYGNIYTVRQAVQLFDRAFGDFSPIDDVWERNGRFVDAFRPQVEPDGYSTAEEVKADAISHLNYVRDVFTKSDWFIFTLGLTEAWRSKLDGAIYPTAPGVAGGVFDSSKYEFVNFSCDEVQTDLRQLIEKIQMVNPDVKILLTVSPVPLIATYENRHVLVSTTYSKAALRVAADVAERHFNNTIYFPSYEIITSPAAGNRYYEDDLRQVTDVGVKHVMRVFGKHFFPNDNLISRNDSVTTFVDSFHKETGIVCDEEVIERALRVSGYSLDSDIQNTKKSKEFGSMYVVHRHLGSDPLLFSQVGVVDGADRKAVGVKGYLLYGPYLELQAGSYHVRLYGQVSRTGSPVAYVEVTINQGKEVLERVNLTELYDTGMVAEIIVNLATSVSDFEVRLWVECDSELIISALEILPDTTIKNQTMVNKNL